MSRNLGEPILDDGIVSTHFFNGRILSAEDLKTEQEAVATRLRHLGRACGSGVVSGLEVKLLENGANGKPPVVSVSPGLAVTGEGGTLSLGSELQVSLSRTIKPVPRGPGVFADCQPPQQAPATTETNVYILVVRPAAGYKQRARMASKQSRGRAETCGSRFSVDGLAFRLIGVEVSMASFQPATTVRNRLAHLCFGTEDLRQAYAFPAQSPEEYGLLDSLRPRELLAECEVPIALLHWTAQGVQFVDCWAARRTPSPESSLGGFGMLSARRRAESTAVMMQFQDHAEAVVGASQTPTALRARDHFRFLPPVGVLPVSVDRKSVGVDPKTFFGDTAMADIATMDGESLRALFDSALSYDPVDLESDRKVQLYFVWENVARANQAVRLRGRLPMFVVFATTSIPYVGVARFDSAKWDRSRYSGPVK